MGCVMQACHIILSVCFVSLSPLVVMFLRDPLEEWQEKQCIHITGFFIALVRLYCYTFCLNQMKAWDQDLKEWLAVQVWSVEFCIKRIYTLLYTQLNNTKVVHLFLKRTFLGIKYPIKTQNIKLNIIQQHVMWIRCRYTVQYIVYLLHCIRLFRN